MTMQTTNVGAVAIVHDYLTQRGGAERVVLSMLRAFPDASVHTALHEPGTTFPELGTADVRTLGMNRWATLRRHHRLAFPLLASAFASLRLDHPVVLCSSSGWSHGVQARGRKIVYCHAPARWLYQPKVYLRPKQVVHNAALAMMRPSLTRWDKRAASTADRYLTNSTSVQAQVWAHYGIDADVLPPPHTIDPGGAQEVVEGLEPGFYLCVSRLMPYKNVDAVVEAFAGLPHLQLVVCGRGPDEARLRSSATSNVTILGSVSDGELRWLYARARALVAASYEDYGLTPVEAAAFGAPSVVLRAGGFLDTVVEGRTGVFFDTPSPLAIRGAVERCEAEAWSTTDIRTHAQAYSEEHFVDRLRDIVADMSVAP